MDSRNRRSPYEQGELKPSPEAPKKKKSSKKSKKSHKLPPEAKPHIRNEEDDDVQIIEAGDHGEEEGGSLTIKPPQALPGRTKERSSHKHKKEKHRSRDQSSDHSKERPKSGSYHRDRGWKPNKDSNPPPKDARTMIKERKRERAMKEKEFDKEVKEREFRKREESIKERERLERGELERRRERQIRDEKNRAMRQQKNDRDFKNSRRGDNKDRRDAKGSGDLRSRSRDATRDQARHFPPPPRLKEDKASKKDSKRRSASPLRVEGDKDRSSLGQDTRRVVVEEKGLEHYFSDASNISEQSFEEENEIKKGPMTPPAPEEEEGEGGKGEEEEEESGDSDSDSDDSDSDSSSEEEDSSDDDDEEEEEEGTEAKGEGKSLADTFQDDAKMTQDAGKVRSKFDDAESVSGGSESPGSDYMPESPELSDVELKPEDALPPYLPAIQGCRSVEEFNCLNRIEEGTYGVVYRALDKKTNEIVALKRLKMEKEKEGFPITSLREINTLLKAQHENIVTVREIVVGSNMDKIYIVMDFVEHDLKSLMECMKNPFLVGEVKTLLLQLIRAVRHLHDNWILHRDLKTSNLLLSHRGILKVGDFGLAREYGSPLRHYTPVVVTLWYRAPELLLGVKEYSTHIDMWSVGCIFAEFLLMKALWPGKSEIDQLNRIFKDLGTPTEAIWPGMSELSGIKKVTFNNHIYNVLRSRFGSYFTDLGFDLMNKLFTFDPSKRITAEDALDHKYFAESPLPVDPSMFPTWPARSEEGSRKHASSPKPPSGGKAYQKLMDDEETLAAGGFHMASGKGQATVSTFSLKF